MKIVLEGPTLSTLVVVVPEMTMSCFLETTCVHNSSKNITPLGTKEEEEEENLSAPPTFSSGKWG